MDRRNVKSPANRRRDNLCGLGVGKKDGQEVLVALVEDSEVPLEKSSLQRFLRVAPDAVNWNLARKGKVDVIEVGRVIALPKPE